jgi:tRNA1Val (adenine37-N6)-methyltransferase
MSNTYFQFKQFTIHQDNCAMKVTTDACLFGAWLAEQVKSQTLKPKTVLDIGTGTGLLSLVFTQNNPESVIDAIEIDKGAYEQAKENIAASPFANCIKLIHGDARNFSFAQKYDIIISNPPFYEKELKSGKENKNVAHHGDELSLKELFSVIKNNLAEDGNFFLLLPYKRYKEIRDILPAHGLTVAQVIFVRQSVKHDYFRIILKGKSKEDGNGEMEMNEISIWNDEEKYTEEFSVLLKDYYLHL